MMQLNDKLTIPGVLARWVGLALSIAATLVFIARWTGQIDSGIQLLNYKLQLAEERASRMDLVLNKVEGMQRLLDDRIAKFDILETESAQRKKAVTSMQTSIEALTFRMHEVELLVRKIHSEGK